MSSTFFYYCKVVVVACIVLSGVAVLIGYKEMAYLIRHKPAAVWRIAIYISVVIPFILPSVKKKSLVNLRHSLQRWKSVAKGLVPRIFARAESNVNVAITKRRISATEVQQLGMELGRLVYNSIDEFEPTWLLSLVDDVPMGIYISNFLKSKNVKVNYSAIASVDSLHLDYITKTCNSTDKLLIVTHVFSTGQDVAALIDALKSSMRNNLPSEIRIASAFECLEKNTTHLLPHYIVETTSDHIVLSHEVAATSDDNQI